MVSKKILITSGAVYGPLDDNKLVSNRVRGIWATRFARWLLHRGHNVTLLVADVQRDQINDHWERSFGGRLTASSITDADHVTRNTGSIDILTHKGFWDYQEQCHMFARTHDAAVMAAAVVNWIPKVPFPGKMPTAGYEPGKAEMNIPFILAPRVIDGMRKENPKLTLIGCKMTIGATRDAMIEAAYATLHGAKCHAVIANDMHAIVDKTPNVKPGGLSMHQLMGLRAKTVLYPDRAQFDFDIGAEEGVNFYKHLEAIITDERFTTVGVAPRQAYDEAGQLWNYKSANVVGSYDECEDLFDAIVDKYRSRFVHKVSGSDRVFGAVAVRTGTGALVSPREKGELFSKRDAVDVLYPTEDDLKQHHVRVIHHGIHEQRDGKWIESGRPVPKASMNATLLLRHLQAHPTAAAVLHLHERLPDRPTVPYAPPGTARDNLRETAVPAYNIDGHGCIVALDQRGEMFEKWDY